MNKYGYNKKLNSSCMFNDWKEAAKYIQGRGLEVNTSSGSNGILDEVIQISTNRCSNLIEKIILFEGDQEYFILWVTGYMMCVSWDKK
jgi:hypothetical protein